MIGLDAFFAGAFLCMLIGIMIGGFWKEERNK